MAERAYELARKLGISSKQLIEVLAERGVEVKNYLAVISDENVTLARSIFPDDKGQGGRDAIPPPGP